MKRNTTIYDVAKEAQVSIATVSRTLARPEKVRVQTKQAVLKAMDKLNWLPDTNAQRIALILAEYRKHRI
jgi:LacI family transcriptional regulator